MEDSNVANEQNAILAPTCHKFTAIDNTSNKYSDVYKNTLKDAIDGGEYIIPASFDNTIWDINVDGGVFKLKPNCSINNW